MKVYGPYKRKDGRWQVTIVKDSGSVTSMSYPKWLYQNHFGIELSINETIDHIDNNPDNNSISNLQVLTRSDNIKKSAVRAEVVDLICKCCGVKFSRRKVVEYYDRVVRHKDGPFAQRSVWAKLITNYERM